MRGPPQGARNRFQIGAFAVTLHWAFERVCSRYPVLSRLLKKLLRPDVINDLASGDEGTDRAAVAVADGMQLGVHAALGATDQAATPPFFAPRLDAVRCAFR